MRGDVETKRPARTLQHATVQVVTAAVAMWRRSMLLAHRDIELGRRLLWDQAPPDRPDKHAPDSSYWGTTSSRTSVVE